MIKNPDHVTIVVTDLEAAKRFFALLGLEEKGSQVISGEVMDAYIGIPGLEADHVTLALKNCTPHFDIQLLHYRHPDALVNPRIRDLYQVGFNHLCFAVDDIEAESARLKAAGVKFRNEIMDFRSRKLTFFEGPDGITLELSELK